MMDNLDDIKTIVCLGNSNMDFKNVYSKAVHPILHQGYWTIAIDKSEVGNIVIKDGNTLSIIQHMGGLNYKTTTYLYFKISNCIFIHPKPCL